MSEMMISRRETTIFQVASFVILGAAAAVGFAQTSSTTVRGVMVALLLIIGILQLRGPNERSPRWQVHLYLGIQGSLVAALVFLVPGWTMFPVLYCLFSFQAILLLSPNPGVLWIVVYVLVTAASFAIRIQWREGPIAIVLYGAINAFFGAFAYALLRANTSRRESQALLAELQEAHRQLQEYALRAEELAVVEERNRLAREMHDTIGHRLTVASVQLEGAQRLCPSDPERAAGMIGTVRQQVREALAELRATVATLRTPVEADLQLRSSLKRLIAHFEEATGLTVHRVLPEEMPNLSHAHRLALVRTTQEALTNVQKHAGANQVWFFLTIHERAITLLVSDDGKGISLSGEMAGYGLRGLRERAGQLEGELHLEPRQGGGSQLSLRLPLPVEGAAARSTDTGRHDHGLPEGGKRKENTDV
jgi:signal transduction histidine kinase